MARKGGNPDLVKFQWQPGESGNPAGKPEGAKSLVKTLQRLIDGKIKLNGIHVDVAEAAGLELISIIFDPEAKDSDKIAAYKEACDRTEGKAIQSMIIDSDSLVNKLDVTRKVVNSKDDTAK